MSLCFYREQQAYSAIPCTLVQIHFSYVLVSYEKLSKWPPRTSRHASICLVVFERNGAGISSVLQMHNDCLLTLYKIVTCMISECKDGRTDGLIYSLTVFRKNTM